MPDRLITQLAARALTTGQTKTEALVEILTQVFSPMLGEHLTEARLVDETPQLMAQMAQQVRMLNQILSVSPDLLFAYDRIGRFTYVNAAAARIFGFQASDLLGQTWREIDLPPDLAAHLSAQHELVLTTGRTICDEISFPADNTIKIYECIFNPIWNDNRIDSSMCTGRDITWRKQAETIWRESEEKYRTLFESAKDAIFIIDIATRQCLNVNQTAAQQLGYTCQEMQQLSLLTSP